MITFKNIKNWFKTVYKYAEINMFIMPMLCIFFIMVISYFHNINENKNVETKENIFWESNRDFNFIITEKLIKNKDFVIKSRFIKNNEGFNEKEVYLIFNYIDGVNLNVGDSISVQTSYSKIYESTERFTYDNPVKILKPDEYEDINLLSFLGILLLVGISILIIFLGGNIFENNENAPFVNGANSISLRFIILGAGLILAYFVKSCQ